MNRDLAFSWCKGVWVSVIENPYLQCASAYAFVQCSKRLINQSTRKLKKINNNLTYSRWTSSLPSCLWSLRIFPSLPGSRLTIFSSRCKFSTLTTRQPMVGFYLLTFPRFPLRKKEHKSYLGKNRTHDFRTSRCAGYLLDHSGDEGLPSTHEKRQP